MFKPLFRISGIPRENVIVRKLDAFPGNIGKFPVEIRFHPSHNSLQIGFRDPFRFELKERILNGQEHTVQLYPGKCPHIQVHLTGQLAGTVVHAHTGCELHLLHEQLVKGSLLSVREVAGKYDQRVVICMVGFHCGPHHVQFGEPCKVVLVIQTLAFLQANRLHVLRFHFGS